MVQGTVAGSALLLPVWIAPLTISTVSRPLVTKDGSLRSPLGLLISMRALSKYSTRCLPAPSPASTYASLARNRGRGPQSQERATWPAAIPASASPQRRAKAGCGSSSQATLNRWSLGGPSGRSSSLRREILSSARPAIGPFTTLPSAPGPPSGVCRITTPLLSSITFSVGGWGELMGVSSQARWSPLLTTKFEALPGSGSTVSVVARQR